jgi:hypothetical protein
VLVSVGVAEIVGVGVMVPVADAVAVGVAGGVLVAGVVAVALGWVLVGTAAVWLRRCATCEPTGRAVWVGEVWQAARRTFRASPTMAIEDRRRWLAKDEGRRTEDEEGTRVDDG